MIFHATTSTRLAVRGDDLVLLDLVAGTYACLPGAGRAMRPRKSSNAIEIDDAELGEVLCAVGALGRSASGASPFPSIPELPVRDLLTEPEGRSEPKDLLAIALAYADMARTFHGRTFSGILDAARSPAPTGTRCGPTRAVVSQAITFRRWLPWLPFQGQCLYRSFLLLGALRLRGRDARWVFGVQTWPFEAHCWLQVGDTVLDDAADRVAAYTPIHAL